LQRFKHVFEFILEFFFVKFVFKLDLGIIQLVVFKFILKLIEFLIFKLLFKLVEFFVFQLQWCK
jgi:hypothetical protein